MAHDARATVPEGALRVALVSLEPWDDTWRRNQHFAASLVRSGAVSSLLFLEPPRLDGRSGPIRDPMPGVRAAPLRLRLPRRAGGLAELGRRLKTGPLKKADVLWINDPALGVYCLRAGQPAVYDVTDDWRTYGFPSRITRRIIAAEDELARRARTIVCSVELQRRWRARYGIEAAVVYNGIDAAAWRRARPHHYAGSSPHVGYVGTLQAERLDIDLVLRIADDVAVGTVHLIGPDALDDLSRKRLRSHAKVAVHPPVPKANVPAWTKGLDVLLSPHLVTAFTLSLDAIKSYEYLASGRPVVATPTSGFQLLCDRPQLEVVPNDHMLAAVKAALRQPSIVQDATDESWDWTIRAQDLRREIDAARGAHALI